MSDKVPIRRQLSLMISEMIKGFVIVLGMATVSAGFPSAAEDGVDVYYAFGSASTTKAGVAGKLDYTKPASMEFHATSGTFSVRYAGITSVKYREENRFRLGALPTVAVGLLKARAKRHLVTVVWTDEAGVSQMAEFEMPKQASLALITLLRIRAPQVCAKKMACNPNSSD
jgi:hypothetical protein